jgi:hypothetical protein
MGGRRVGGRNRPRRKGQVGKGEDVGEEGAGRGKGGIKGMIRWKGRGGRFR